MSNALPRAKVLRLRPASDLAATPIAPLRVRLRSIADDGLLTVCDCAGREFICEWLDAAVAGPALQEGDRLLALAPAGEDPGVVLGRIGRYRAPAPTQPARALVIEATESLSLQCGDARVDLRADGKMMIRGEDVLIRARGTQRIKAGTVNIN